MAGMIKGMIKIFQKRLGSAPVLKGKFQVFARALQLVAGGRIVSSPRNLESG
jgi:hypothetical protein